MTLCGCKNKWDCTGIAIIASLVVGIIAAFLQITAVITVTPVFLWVAFGIAVVYLAITLIAASFAQDSGSCGSPCVALSALLLGILGTVLFAVVLLAITFAATSVIGAIIVGGLVFSFSLTLTSTACLVKHLINCCD